MLETFTKLKKRILSPLVSLVMKLRKNIKSMYQEKMLWKKHVNLLLIEETGKKALHSCIIICCGENTMEENIFFVNVYKPSVPKKY